MAKNKNYEEQIKELYIIVGVLIMFCIILTIAFSVTDNSYTNLKYCKNEDLKAKFIKNPNTNDIYYDKVQCCTKDTKTYQFDEMKGEYIKIVDNFCTYYDINKSNGKVIY